MKATMSPKSAAFKSGILFFNLRESRHEIVDADIYPDYDLCFFFDKHAVYVGIDPGLEFGVRDLATGEMYGPYDNYMSVVSLHMFGQYDNLIKFLRESFVFDVELGAYRFIFGNFRYARGVYDFTEDIPKTARRMFDYLPPMNEPFEYEFSPTTYFAEGALEIFVNRLNIMFNQNNFTEEVEEDENYIMASVNRASGYGVRRSTGKAFFVANMSKRRHSVLFAPSRMPVEYIGFLSNGTQEAEDVMFDYITSAPVTTVTNKSKVGYYQDRYGIDSTIHSVDIAEYSLFDNIVFVLTPTDDARLVYIFVKTTYGIIPVEFDPFEKKFTIFDKTHIQTISAMLTNAALELDGDTLKYAFDADIADVATSGDLAMKLQDSEFYVDCDKNKAYTEEGNVFAINYAGDLLNNIFV